MAQPKDKPSIDQVIVKVTDMVSYDNNANKLAKAAGLNINYVSWEDCARNKNSVWGPCISDMTLRVNNSCMPVIRKPNYTDITWDVKMNQIPIIIGNETSDEKEELQTISLDKYLTNFNNYISNNYYKKTDKQINLLSQKENKDSHVIMSSQTCFLPIQSGEETKFNVALFNYQSQLRNPAVLVIVSTSKGTSAQIIEGKEQYLLFNNNGKKADFIGERVSDIRKKKKQKNIKHKKLSKEEKQDNVIVIIQIPLKQKKRFDEPEIMFMNQLSGDEDNDDWCADDNMVLEDEQKEDKSNVEAAIVKIAERTKPVCICNKELKVYQVQFAYNGNDSISCDGCGVTVNGKQTKIYHCEDNKNYVHENGYDLCVFCAEKQLMFDELRGMFDEDKNYILERDESYPIRVTLQYYKATDNGVVTKDIMDDIVKQLECSQKQADFIGSLVVDYDENRPSEWVDNDDKYKEIRKVLEEKGGKDWKIYMENFEQNEVEDRDLNGLRDDDLKELIPKIGPRNRIREWIECRKQIEL